MKYFSRIIPLLIFVATSLPTFAQPTGGDPNNGGKPAPITGIELLLLAGGLFGVKKLISRKKRN